MTKQRKKSKWDQPAESLVSAGVAVPGILPLGHVGSLVGIGHPGAGQVYNSSLANPLATSYVTPSVFQAPLVQQHANAIVQKLNQPKIQDELIAKEIVINDADPAVRYKLTKRQTQEEIQKSTGAVVITRGKYRPPDAPQDGEKPLYLHISAGAHLDTTVERIKAVDRAAAMVEEMLKLGLPSIVAKVCQPLSTCVYLGFEADPSLNVAAHIRGPNDQYINHIMNETGATVLLRGRGSGDSSNSQGEEGEQPLHLLLSSNNSKSLERAKLLAENLLDTISTGFGASRVSSNKVYGAVPPPQQLLTGVETSGNESKTNVIQASGLTSASIPAPSISTVATSITTVFFQGATTQSVGGLNSGQSRASMITYPQPSVTVGTNYNGYSGIYPQATPLQQVAQALKHSVSPSASTIIASTAAARTPTNTNVRASTEEEKRPPQKRKFQELPVASKIPAKSNQNPTQGSEILKPCESTMGLTMRDVPTIIAPKKSLQLSSNGMPPPPPRLMVHSPRTLPLPLPKFNSTPSGKALEGNNILNKSKTEAVPDTLVKLMEYGDEDDDVEETIEEPISGNSNTLGRTKPFWAV